METIFVYLVPLTNIPQTFEINFAGTNYTMTVKWNDIAQSWYMDLSDDQQNPLACGIPFITGADLLEQLEYLGVDGQLFVYTNGDDSAVPTLDNLGSNSNLYFQSTVDNSGS